MIVWAETGSAKKSNNNTPRTYESCTDNLSRLKRTNLCWLISANTDKTGSWTDIHFGIVEICAAKSMLSWLFSSTPRCMRSNLANETSPSWILDMSELKWLIIPMAFSVTSNSTSICSKEVMRLFSSAPNWSSPICAATCIFLLPRIAWTTSSSTSETSWLSSKNTLDSMSIWTPRCEWLILSNETEILAILKGLDRIWKRSKYLAKLTSTANCASPISPVIGRFKSLTRTDAFACKLLSSVPRSANLTSRLRLK